MHHKKGKSLGLKRFLKHSVLRNIIRKMMTKQLYWQLATPVLNYSFPNLLILKYAGRDQKAAAAITLSRVQKRLGMCMHIGTVMYNSIHNIYV